LEGTSITSNYFRPYVEIFIREAFRFTNDRGLTRRVKRRQEKLIAKMGLHKTITTYHECARRLEKASDPDHGYTLELVTSAKSFANIMLMTINNPYLTPIDLELECRWVEKDLIFHRQIRYINIRPTITLSWDSPKKLYAKDIRKMVEKFDFEVIEMTDEQINSELEKLKDEGKSAYEIILNVRCTNCGGKSTKSLRTIVTSAHCGYCMKQIYSHEEYAIYSFKSLFSTRMSCIMTDIKGIALNAKQIYEFWKKQDSKNRFLLRDIFPNKKGVRVRDENGYMNLNKRLHKYKAGTRDIIFDTLVHVDAGVYIKFKIKDEKGNFIKDRDGKTDMIFKFFLERQGEQHENSKDGFEVWLRIHQKKELADIVRDSSSIPNARARIKNKKNLKFFDYEFDSWKDQLARDQDKVFLFNYYKKDGYYLLIMDHNIDSNQMLEFISSEVALIINSYLTETIPNIRGEELVSLEDLRESIENKLLPFSQYIPLLKVKLKKRQRSIFDY